MWANKEERAMKCTRAVDCLEAASLPRTAHLEDLLATLPPDLAKHASVCRDCRESCELFLQSSRLLAPLASPEEIAPPFFSKRVLATIRAKEDEMERTLRAWAAVPKMASRLAAVAMLVLFLAGTWLYKGPNRKPAVTEASVESTTGIVEDTATVPVSKDDVLVSVLEREQ